MLGQQSMRIQQGQGLIFLVIMMVSVFGGLIIGFVMQETMGTITYYAFPIVGLGIILFLALRQ